MKTKTPTKISQQAREENIKRAVAITNKWPDWKKNYQLTKWKNNNV